jgi:hypothetical protein
MNSSEKFTEGRKNGETPLSLYRYRSASEIIDRTGKSALDKLLDGLKENYLYFSEWEGLNDPFEGQVSFRQSYSKDEIFEFLRRRIPVAFADSLIEKAKKDSNNFLPILESMLPQIAKDVLDKANKKVKICCFSKKNNNILMWAHYADSHKGICLEFDYQQDVLVFSELIPMQYKTNYLQYNIFGDREEICKKLVSHKSIDWKYEDEYRVFKFETNENVIFYKPQALKSVIFGCKASENTIREVKKSLSHNPHLVLKKCETDNNSYKLNIVDF